MPTFDMKPKYVPQDVLDGLKSIPGATVYGAVCHFGCPLNVCEGLRNLTPGKQRFAARAVTLRFLPRRADLMAEKPGGVDDPEYIAMGKCGPGDVLVADIMGSSRDVLAGDVKLLHLAMNNADGAVIDGAIRDLDVMTEEDYGLTIYAKHRSFHGGVDATPAEVNIQIQCGGAPATCWWATTTACWWCRHGWPRPPWSGRWSTKTSRTTSRRRSAPSGCAPARTTLRPRR